MTEAILDPQTIAETPPAQEKEKDSTNSLFKALLEKITLYREENTAYAMLNDGSTPSLHRLRSDGFARFLKTFAYEHNGRGLGQNATGDMLDTLEAMAFKHGQPCKASLRFSHREGVAYLDLCNDTWQVVAIHPEGWSIFTPIQPMFIRAKRMRPLPLPIQGGNSEALWQFFNLPEERDRFLLRTWLLTALLANGTNTAIIFHGEQGSAKSTSTRLLRALIDPNQSDLRALPRDERDLFIAAQSNAVLAFDNMSGISKPMSDALCRIVYGGGYSTRKLHSNDEEMLLEAKANLILNGIDDIASRQDLIERAVIITLPPIPPERRKPEEVFQQEFAKAHPHLLGALLDDLAKVLRYLPQTPTSNLPRMTTYARVGMGFLSFSSPIRHCRSIYFHEDMAPIWYASRRYCWNGCIFHFASCHYVCRYFHPTSIP